jgi:hypothetical protein
MINSGVYTPDEIRLAMDLPVTDDQLHSFESEISGISSHRIPEIDIVIPPGLPNIDGNIITIYNLIRDGYLDTRDGRDLLVRFNMNSRTQVRVHGHVIEESVLTEQMYNFESELGGTVTMPDSSEDMGSVVDEKKPIQAEVICKQCLYKDSPIIGDKYSNSGKQLVICSHLQRDTGKKWNIIPEGKCNHFKSIKKLFDEPSRWKRLTFKG